MCVLEKQSQYLPSYLCYWVFSLPIPLHPSTYLSIEMAKLKSGVSHSGNSSKSLKLETEKKIPFQLGGAASAFSGTPSFTLQASKWLSDTHTRHHSSF